MFLESDGRPIKYAILLSGGMDSAVLMYHLHPTNQVAITVDYGQSHSREIEAARKLCELKSIKHVVLSVKGIRGGSLCGDSEEMQGISTVVPNRNAILLMLAANVAISEGCNRMAIGCNENDQHIYADCRPDFLMSIGKTISLLHGIRLSWPFLNKSKSEIRELGIKLSVPLSDTWSCYRGGSTPCGSCGACIEVARAVAGLQ